MAARALPDAAAKAIGNRGIPRDENGRWLHQPELQTLENDPDATIPRLESPEQYLLFVTGGTTHYALFFYGTYGVATRPVEELWPTAVADRPEFRRETGATQLESSPPP